MISARALGVYMYLRSTDAHINAENLSQVFKEGRDAMSAAIKELRSYNIIATKKERIGGRIMTVNRLVEPDYWALETRRLIPLYMQNSNLILNDNSFISKKIVFGEAKGEEQAMDSDWYSLGQIEQDPEEQAELKRRYKEKRDREYREARDAKAEANMASRINTPPSLWTIDNSAYEFASRMVRWDISPWEGSRMPFKAAFAKARKDFNTTGDIELKMMDIFFGRLDHEKKVKDSDMVWRLFIRDYASLLAQVEQSMVTPDDVVKAKELSDKQWEKF